MYVVCCTILQMEVYINHISDLWIFQVKFDDGKWCGMKWWVYIDDEVWWWDVEMKWWNDGAVNDDEKWIM